MQDRFESGEMVGIQAPDALKLITTEWNALPQPEKQKYVDAATADHSRFEREYEQLFGRPHSSRKSSPSP